MVLTADLVDDINNALKRSYETGYNAAISRVFELIEKEVKK